MNDTPIYLRPIREEDTDNIVKWRNNNEVRKFFIYQGTFTREGHLSWYENRVKTGEVVQFIIVEKETEASLGSVFFRDIDRVNNKAEYGIFIGENNARGKGYGTIATKLALDYAFNVEHIHRIFLRVLADNDRAINSYCKAGFVQEGILNDDVRINGIYRSIVWMAAINPNDSSNKESDYRGENL